jgi:hypothetical protein
MGSPWKVCSNSENHWDRIFVLPKNTGYYGKVQYIEVSICIYMFIIIVTAYITCDKDKALSKR